MRAGLMTHTHSSGAPLPLPIRVSSGFLVIGLSGKMRIQILPPRLTWRGLRGRAASLQAGVAGRGGDGLGGEDADPDLATTLDVAGHRDTGSLDLAGGDPPHLERLQ